MERADFAFGRADDVPGSAESLGSVQQGGDALVRLNDAFAPDPVFVDVPAGRARGSARAHRALVRRVRRPSPARACAPAKARGVRGGGLRRGRGCRPQRSWCPSPSWPPATVRRSPTSPLQVLGEPPGRSPAWPDAGWRSPRAHLHRRPGWRLRPGPGRRLGRGEGRPQRDPLRLPGRRDPGARHPHPAGPCGAPHDQRAAVPGRGGRNVALGLQRA